jgi:hypothetical protein
MKKQVVLCAWALVLLVLALGTVTKAWPQPGGSWLKGSPPPPESRGWIMPIPKVGDINWGPNMIECLKTLDRRLVYLEQQNKILTEALSYHQAELTSLQVEMGR